MTTPVKVLYIAGTQRGGTTIAGRLLGAAPGCAFVGELRRLWAIGVHDDTRCGCGAGVRECPVWSVVLPKVVDGGPELQEVRRWQDLLSSGFRVPSGPRRTLARSRVANGARQTYGALLSSTYQAIADATGARVVVDSSKSPAEGRLVLERDDIDAWLLHLVRDPRATTYSVVRRSGRPGTIFGAHPREALSAATGWAVRHATSNAVARAVAPRRSMVVRYEAMVAQPNQFVAAVLTMIGEPLPDDDVVVHGAFRAGPDHTPTGAGRFVAARVELRRDDRWQHALGSVDRAVATALTAPVAFRYGYGPLGWTVRDWGGRPLRSWLKP